MHVDLHVFSTLRSYITIFKKWNKYNNIKFYLFCILRINAMK